MARALNGPTTYRGIRTTSSTPRGFVFTAKKLDSQNSENVKYLNVISKVWYLQVAW